VHNATIYPLRVQNKEILTGLKIGDTITINIKELYNNDEKEISYTLGIEKEKVSEIEGLFLFTVESITRHDPADLNEEFYKKMFPYVEIQNEDEFKEALRKDYDKQSEIESDKKFQIDLQKKLIDNLDIQLPDAFLKRWILESSEEKDGLTPEKVEADYLKYADSIKWQVIESRIMAQNEIKVDRQDVVDYVKSWFKIEGEEVTPEMEERAEKVVETILGKEEEARRIYDKLLNERLTALYKEKVKTIPTEVSFEEFVKLG